MAWITIPYTFVAMALCLLVGFYKLGDLDEEIGPILGLGTGILVLIANHFIPWGYLGLVLYAIGGFILLTAYKIILGISESKGGGQEDSE